MFFDCDARIFIVMPGFLIVMPGKEPGYLAANVTVRGDYRFE